VLEEQVASGGTSVPRVQYVWSPVYVDALVLRDRDTDADGTLDERLYVAQDANYNVTAIFDNAGTVVERYVYDPFGQATLLTPDWEQQANSSFGWQHLHQGLRFESAIGLYDSRARWYSATQMRFISGDPVWGVNLYVGYGNNPTGAIDPGGLWWEEGGTWEPNLTQAQVARWRGQWRQLDLEVVVMPGFNLRDVQPVMNRVARYFANRGILINYHIRYWRTPPVTNVGAFACSGNGPGWSWQPRRILTSGEIAAFESFWHASRIDVDERLESRAHNEGLAQSLVDFYRRSFEQRPTLFFVAEIFHNGEWVPGATPGAFDYRFAFVASSSNPASPQYDRVAAHELVHVLGVEEHADSGLMTEAAPDFWMWLIGAQGNPHLNETYPLVQTSDPSWLSRRHEQIIRNSPLLRRIPDPVADLP
jgi:RHS repeat-associated protein